MIFDLTTKISSEQMVQWLEKSEQRHITAGHIGTHLFRTSRIERFSYGSREYFLDHPQLSKELIEWLLSRKIGFLGIDCSGIRRGDEHRAADIHCEEHGVYVIENLCNLDKLADAAMTVYTKWLDDPEMTGLKCRVIAEQNAE